MRFEEPVGTEAILATIASLVPQPTGVVVVALSENAYLVPVPESVPCVSKPELSLDAALDIFAAEDHEAIVNVWMQAVHEGAGWCRVRLARRPDERVNLFIGDYRHEYGVFLAVVEGADLDAGDVQPPERFTIPRVCTFKANAEMIVIDVDDAFTRMMGWEREELLGTLGNATVHPDDYAEMVRAYAGATSSSLARTVRMRRQRKDGSYLWVDSTYFAHLDDTADPHVLVQLVDVSEQVHALSALHEREALLSQLTQSLPEGIFQIDRDRHIVYANGRLQVMLASAPSDDLDVMLDSVAEDYRSAVDAAITNALDGGEDADLEIDITPTGDSLPRRCLLSVRTISDSEAAVIGAVGCVSDVTEASQMRQELEDRATFDPLTRCYNRASVMRILDDAMARPERARTAAVFVDIDHFKPVNDRFGHAAGDNLLTALACRIHSVLRGADVVGRIGGDEFLIVCRDVVDEDDLVSIADRVHRAVAESFVVGGERLQVHSSIGVARCATSDGTADDRAVDADELVRRADVAMYASKREGLGRPAIYRSEMETAHSGNSSGSFDDGGGDFGSDQHSDTASRLAGARRHRG